MDPNNINHYLLQAVCKGCAPHNRTTLLQALGDEDSEMSGVDRRNMNGHFVASAVVLNETHNRVLMIHHKFLQKVLFPGGHIDPNEDAMIAAFREVFEETGIAARPLLHYPIDIDSHIIPENPNKGEGAHVHHDLLFVGEANSTQSSMIAKEEITFAQWIPIENLREMGERNVRVHDRIAKVLKA